MTAWRTYILAWLLIGSAFCRADTSGSGALSTTEYRAELDHLLTATQQLDSSGAATPQQLHDLPQSWHVHSDQREFDISTEGLQRDVRRYESEKNVATATDIRTRLWSLRSDLDGFERPVPDVSTRRTDLNSILARPEFHDVSGPGWSDRLKQRLLSFLLHSLGRLFGSSVIPTISKYFVYVLMGIAIAFLGYFAYRSFFSDNKFETVVPTDVPISAKEWAIWLKERMARGDSSRLLGGNFFSRAPRHMEAGSRAHPAGISSTAREFE
jgi:hypothetical protein